jgi:hypothetical protein
MEYNQRPLSCTMALIFPFNGCAAQSASNVTGMR